MVNILAPVLAVPVHAYIRHQRDRFDSQCRALLARERIVMGKYFRPEVLDHVRIAVADPLPIPDPPFASWMRRLRFSFPKPSVAAAITFDNVIVCRAGPEPSLLFHELVHVVQYQILGVQDFAREYVRGFLESRSYSEIPLERIAFGLQFQFETSAQEFDVEQKVRQQLRSRQGLTRDVAL